MTEKKENYRTLVRYYTSRPEQKKQKYITIVLPENSKFNIDDCVSISIEPSQEPFTVSVSSSKRITIGSILRQMEISDVVTFDIARWETVRSVASQLKRYYGCTYSVRKDKHNKENIIVTRLS